MARPGAVARQKAGQHTAPYRRQPGRMDRRLLRQEVEFAGGALRHAAQPGTLLDLCCGTGEGSALLRAPGFRALGLDLNMLALAEFRQQSRQVPLVQGDALRLPFCSGSLDAIVALHCFDLVDRPGFLQSCNRVLRPGGLLILDALNRHSYKLLLKRLGRSVLRRFARGPADKWIDVASFREVLRLLARAGFELQSAAGYSWPPFAVNSDSRLVDAAAFVEQVLRLDRHPHISPRAVIAARKKREGDE